MAKQYNSLNILLIGGTGVLSSAVTAEALRKGINVTMINRGRRRSPDGVTLIKADMTDVVTIKAHLQGRFFDAVIDFLCYNAAQTKASFELYSQYTKQYFYISSCAVYDTRNGGMAGEDYPKVLPMWEYSVDKWAGEQLLANMATMTDTNYTIIRPSVTYDDTRIPYGITPQYGYHWTLVERIRHGKPIIRWNKGLNHSNMTRVEDFAIGVVGLIGKSEAYNEAFNVCGEETPTFNDVLAELKKLVGTEIKTVDIDSEFYAAELPWRSGEILGGRSIDSINSNNKLKTVVPEFKQSINLSDGIKMTYDAYKEVPHQLGIDWLFDADTDRIIAKWCKRNGIDTSDMKLGFIDYLGDATGKERRVYWLEYYKENRFLKGWKMIVYLFRRLVGKFFRLVHIRK